MNELPDSLDRNFLSDSAPKMLGLFFSRNVISCRYEHVFCRYGFVDKNPSLKGLVDVMKQIIDGPVSTEKKIALPSDREI